MHSAAAARPRHNRIDSWWPVVGLHFVGMKASEYFHHLCDDSYTALFSDTEVTELYTLFNYSFVSGSARQVSLSFTISQSLLKLLSIELVMPSNHLILCHPLLLPPSIYPSIRVFSNESVLCIRWPKYWSFSFSISPSSEYSVLPMNIIDFKRVKIRVYELHLNEVIFLKS